VNLEMRDHRWPGPLRGRLAPADAGSALHHLTEDDLNAELAMIDENLCLTNMALAERARIMARRDELYGEKHPDQKRGTPGTKARWNTSETVSPAFTSEAAAITGNVERVVQLDVSRGTKNGEDALALVTCTPLDNARYLDKLKRLPKVERVERDLANPPARTKPSAAVAYLA
jgi:hypothetical protein